MTTNVISTGLAYDLAQREAYDQPIRVGLIGCGEMGTDIITALSFMQGIDLALIIDRKPQRSLEAIALSLGESGHGRVVKTHEALNHAIKLRDIAICETSDLLFSSDQIDVVVEATGIPSVGAEMAIKAMESGKHMVMMNVEADVTVGPYLRLMADKLGVVYSVGAGDEPSSCMELIEFVSALGHEIVCAGKGKNNPLNIDATPDQYEAESKARNMNPRMLVEFVDGTKTMVEMTAIANATGLIPDIAGMHGPMASLEALETTLIPKQDGGILRASGRVDFTVGKGVAPGVFVIAKMAHPRLMERMNDLKLGKGPYFTFIRPFHLTSLEVPLTCARAVLYKKADMVPLDQPVAEVCARAKADLDIGHVLGQIGEYSYRGFIMTRGEAQANKAVPCGLLSGGRVIKAIKKGDLLTYDNCQPPADQLIVKIRKAQDKILFSSKL